MGLFRNFNRRRFSKPLSEEKIAELAARKEKQIRATLQRAEHRGLEAQREARVSVTLPKLKWLDRPGVVSAAD